MYYKAQEVNIKKKTRLLDEPQKMCNDEILFSDKGVKKRNELKFLYKIAYDAKNRSVHTRIMRA